MASRNATSYQGASYHYDTSSAGVNPSVRAAHVPIAPSFLPPPLPFMHFAFCTSLLRCDGSFWSRSARVPAKPALYLVLPYSTVRTTVQVGAELEVSWQRPWGDPAEPHWPSGKSKPIDTLYLFICSTAAKALHNVSRRPASRPRFESLAISRRRCGKIL